MRRSKAPSRILSPGGGSSGSNNNNGFGIEGGAPYSFCGGGGAGGGGGGSRSAAASSQEMKRVNTAALRQGSVSVVRAPLLGCLTVPRGGGLVVGAFKLPGGARRTDESKGLLRRKSLGVRRPVTFMTSSKFRPPSPPDAAVSGEFDLQEGEDEGDGKGAEAEAAPTDEADTFEPLVLWEEGPGEDDHRISVDPRLCKFLRPHQREGVQFMFECVMGMREFEGSGCILADDMGLGKTLQSIAVLWTLLKQGKAKGQPAVRRAVVVCPTSLVKNWEAEIDKWLKGDCRVIALSETTREQVVQSINLFLASMVYRVLIVSYETFRLHSKRFYAKADTCCDLLICDEAHRLKNADTATNQALSALKCRKRVLLSGTPMQNDLEEFYAMTDFTNPGVLGSGASFRKKFLSPILAGREPSATDKQVERAQKCQNEMSTVVNEFILRRTNNINAKHLPPKLVQVVCCRLTPVQTKIYKHLLSSKEIRHILNGKQTNILSSIGAMQKLCNHPKLLVEGAAGRDSGSHAEIASMLPAETSSSSALAGGVRGRGMSSAGGFGRRSSGGMQKGVFPEWSGKMETLFRLMREMRSTGDDRIVVVSNFTSSLDLIGSMCRENSWPFVRLDGSTGVSKRQKMVNAFNEPGPQSFAFLLSSKAGGCGLNLIGGNRLVLFDPDWNPAVDKQAAARVWRDGQKKRCFVYRFVSTGTIEEKVFQRQLSKEGLQNIVDDKEEVNSLSSKDLKDLFKLYEGTPSDTHDKLRCKRCNIDEAVQAVKDIDESGLRRALPQQLALCEELLSELSALPEGATFLHQWDPEEENVTAENFANAVHEPMDFTKIAARLRASTRSTLEQRQQQQADGGGDVGGGQHADVTRPPLSAVADGNGGYATATAAADVPSPDAAAGSAGAGAAAGATPAVPYTNVPAFTRDMRLVFQNVRRMWPPGSIGGENRLTQAADALKLAFEMRWSALAPRVHRVQREALETARLEAKDREARERAEDWTPPAKFQEQMGMPKEEDLNSWSHHYSTDTADDPVFRGAMMGTGDSLVSFVFGLEVTWDLLSVQLEQEAEARTLEIKVKNDARAARAAEKKKAASAATAAAAAGTGTDDDGDVGDGAVGKTEGGGSSSTKGKRKKKKNGACGGDGCEMEGSTVGVDGGGAAAGGGGEGGEDAEVEDGGVETEMGEEEEGGDKEEEEEEEEEEDEEDEAWMNEEGDGGKAKVSPRSGSRRRKMMENESDEDEDDDEQVASTAEEEGTQIEGAPANTPGGEEEGGGDGIDGGTEEEEQEVLETPPLVGSAEAGEEDWRVPTNGASESAAAGGGPAAAAAAAAGGVGDEENSSFRSPPSRHEGNREASSSSSASKRRKRTGVSSGAAAEGSGGIGSSSGKTEWLCSVCTFANALSTRKCIMCLAGCRPRGMGRSNPLSPRSSGDANRGRGQEEEEEDDDDEDFVSAKKKSKSKKDGKGKKGNNDSPRETAGKKQQKPAKEKKRKREIWIDDDEDFE